jgi:dsRNA-specific ribonuclease
MEKESKVKLENYNLLEFIGDSVMNFLVTDFYFKHSERSDLRKIYGHDQIHKLKTELTNNNFIAIVMIELGLHEFIKIKERTATFNISFANFV